MVKIILNIKNIKALKKNIESNNFDLLLLENESFVLKKTPNINPESRPPK